MKRQVFIRSFGAPILLGVLLLFKINYNTKPFSTFVDIALFASVSLSALLSDSRYIRGFRQDKDQLIIDYLTCFLQPKTIDVPVATIEQVKLSKWKRFNLWSPTLQLKAEGTWLTFHVVSKKVYDEIQEQPALTSIALLK